MNELALFAGAGGGILASKILGWRTVCAVEIDSHAATVLAARQNDGTLPPFPIWSDVQTFDGKPWRGIVDVISGGFPCQDISIAKPDAKGLEGTRSGLWKEFARIISEVQPSYVFVENSPMLAVRGGPRVIADLAKMGYVGRFGTLGGSCIGNVAEGSRLWVVATKAHRPMLESLDFPQPEQPCEEESCRRQRARAISAMLCQDDYTRIKRNSDAVARGMDRLHNIGNGQVPELAAFAFETLSQGMKGMHHDN